MTGWHGDPEEYLLVGDGEHLSGHATKEAAIKHARELGLMSFEVYDGDDYQVFAERPESHWV